MGAPMMMEKKIMMMEKKMETMMDAMLQLQLHQVTQDQQLLQQQEQLQQQHFELHQLQLQQQQLQPLRFSTGWLDGQFRQMQTQHEDMRDEAAAAATYRGVGREAEAAADEADAADKGN